MSHKPLLALANRICGLAIGAIASASLLTGAAFAEPAIWVVKGPTKTIYLFGTVHLLKPDAAWMTPKIKTALEASGELELEIANLDDQASAQSAVLKYGVDQQHPLSTRLPDPLKAKLAKAEAGLGVPPQALEPLKPWLAALTLDLLPLQKAGYDPKSGVELNLLAAARARKEPVTGFETIEQQLQYFDSLPEAQQLAYLDESINDVDRIVPLLDKVEHAWEQGDVDTIAHYLNDDMKKEDPKLYDLLLTKRNERFADQIVTQLNGSGVIFVAVGAGHLAGPDSVQAQLQKRGVKVDRF